MLEKNTAFCKNIWSLISPYWKSNDKWKAFTLLLVIILLTIGQVYIHVLINGWLNDFYDSLQRIDKVAFFNAILNFSYLATIFIIIAVYNIYLSQMLVIRWRRWLTADYLERWLSKQNYYRMQFISETTDNPDQRISEDVNQFISLTLGLLMGLLSAVATLCFFVNILWKLSGPLSFQLGPLFIYIPAYLVWAALGYAIIGTYLISYIGRPLIQLNFNQQRFEADFRFSMARFRENSENIAFYRGETEEKQNFFSRFSAVFNNFWQIMKRQKRLTWFTSFYSQAAFIFPFLVAGPRFFAKQIDLGGVMQIVNAFGQVQGALSYIIDAYTQIAVWKATSNRLISFRQYMEKAEQSVGFTPTHLNNHCIDAKELTIKLPNGQSLMENLSLHLKPGDSMLVTGPSGCGKTTLLRTLSGIWPFAEGKLSTPDIAHMMFLPQKTYLPLGNLKQALCYPGTTAGILDERIKGILRLCQLEHLCDNLDQDRDWSHTLSVGEQQRIGFARAILCKPDFLLMDEATSSLDEPSESYLYQLLKNECPNSCIVSVGHRSSLKTWHEKELLCTDYVVSLSPTISLSSRA